ncbi:MAG: ATP-binding protein [Syntrophobacteraceae bacterium]
MDDLTHQVVGTKFKPHREKKGNEELENWLVRLLEPRLDFRIHEITCDSRLVVIFEIPAVLYMPTRFSGEEFMRIGSYKKKLKDFPEKEKALWAIFRHETFEKGRAAQAVNGDHVLSTHTKAILYAPKKLADMDQQDRIRACYQHACLCWVSNNTMTNTTLRERFGIVEKNYPMASRIIAETIKACLVKPADPANKSRKQAKYVPFWL